MTRAMTQGAQGPVTLGALCRAPERTWLCPILEWFHGVMSHVESFERGLHHRFLYLRLRRIRLGGLKGTTHAQERFRERWRPLAGKFEAIVAFYEALAIAAPEPSPSTGEGELWWAGPIPIIVREGRAITVLPMVLT